MEIRYTQVPSLQEPLSQQMNQIQNIVHVNHDILAFILTGSCSRGSATYRSDIDLLIVIKDQKLTYGKVVAIRDQIESLFIQQGSESLLYSPLPVQMTVVSKSVFSTKEPAMQEALLHGVALVDPEHLLESYVEAA